MEREAVTRQEGALQGSQRQREQQESKIPVVAK